MDPARAARASAGIVPPRLSRTAAVDPVATLPERSAASSDTRCYPENAYRGAHAGVTREHQGRAAHGLPPSPRPVLAVLACASPASRSQRAREARRVTYTDRTITCLDCGIDFIHSAADQEIGRAHV